MRVGPGVHIGVDVRNLSAGPVTGIGRVLIESVRALSDAGARFTFFWPGKRRPSALDPVPRAVHVEGRFSGSVGRTAWGLAALPFAIARHRPDVFWGPAHRLPPTLAASIPAAVTIHDLVWHRFPETMPAGRRLADRTLMGMAVRRADLILAVSQATADDVAAVFGRRAEVTHPGPTRIAPEDQAATLARLGLAAGDYALFVGTLEPRKNLVRLVRAFSAARRSAGRGWQLVVAGGSGWLDGEIQSEVRSAIAAGHVRATGFVGDADLAALYANARFLAMPSLYEGFGLPILEAQRYGVPVLASRRGSLPEVAGEGGLLVDPLDESDIARALARLFTDDDLHAALSAAARENAGRFSWPATAERMLALFDATAARRTG